MTSRPNHVPDSVMLQRLSRQIPDLDSDDVLAAALLRRVAGELTSLLEASLHEHGLSEGRLRILAWLLDMGEPVAHSQLAEATGVTKGTVTGLINGLEGDGLVRRTPARDDRRVSLVELTPAGARVMKEVLPGHLQRLAELLQGVTKTERRTLVSLLRKLSAGLCSPPPSASAERGGAR